MSCSNAPMPRSSISLLVKPKQRPISSEITVTLSACARPGRRALGEHADAQFAVADHLVQQRTPAPRPARAPASVDQLDVGARRGAASLYWRVASNWAARPARWRDLPSLAPMAASRRCLRPAGCRERFDASACAGSSRSGVPGRRQCGPQGRRGVKVGPRRVALFGLQRSCADRASGSCPSVAWRCESW